MKTSPVPAPCPPVLLTVPISVNSNSWLGSASHAPPVLGMVSNLVSNRGTCHLPYPPFKSTASKNPSTCVHMSLPWSIWGKGSCHMLCAVKCPVHLQCCISVKSVQGGDWPPETGKLITIRCLQNLTSHAGFTMFCLQTSRTPGIWANAFPIWLPAVNLCSTTPQHCKKDAAAEIYHSP